MTRSNGYACLTGVMVGLVLVVLVKAVMPARPITPAEAAKMCAETGGVMVVTEYNSESGLTLNCFYPAATAEDFSAQAV